MSSPWTHEHLQHVIFEEVAAVVYAETHDRSPGPAVDAGERPAAQRQGRQSAPPDVPDRGSRHRPGADPG